MLIDLRAIRPFRNSQSAAFEELVCQIARRTIAANNPTWVRIENTTEDNGIEGYYDSPRGRVGVHAKFFVTSEEVDWQQIHHSFVTALKIHANLTEYRVYIACEGLSTGKPVDYDMPDGWHEARERMRQFADAQHRVVAVVLTTARKIAAELESRECVGLSEYWFGKIEITPATLRRWLTSTIGILRHNSHPQNHVEVSAQRAIRALSRSPATIRELTLAVSAVMNFSLPSFPPGGARRDHIARQVKSGARSRARLSTILDNLVSNVSVWPVDSWRQLTRTVFLSTSELLQCSYECEPDVGVRIDIAQVRQSLVELHRRVDCLTGLLQSDIYDIEAARATVVIGAAGTGKTHLLVAGAQEILDEGGISLLFLGRQFHNVHIWQQIVQKLGFDDSFTRDQFLGALDAASLAARQRGVIFIDALEEGDLRSFWADEFDSFVRDIRAFSNLAVLVSCRDLYAPHVLGGDFEKRYPVVRALGFLSPREQEQAAKVFLDGRSIDRPTTPWLMPQLTSPFLLHICSATSKAASAHEHPLTAFNSMTLARTYSTALTSPIARMAGCDAAAEIPCLDILAEVARRMFGHRRDWLTIDEAQAAVAATNPGHNSTDMAWLNILIAVGAFRLDPKSNSVHGREGVIRFAVQLIQDHLIAECLVADATNLHKDFARGGKYAFLLNERGTPHWEWKGLFEALAIHVPEKLRVELIDVLPGEFSYHWLTDDMQRSFVESMRLRSVAAISDRTIQLVDRLNDMARISLLVELAPRSAHPCNARLLNRQLKRLKGWNLDQNFTVPLSHGADNEGHPLHRLLDWCENAPKEKVDPQVIELCAFALTWVLSCFAPSVRNSSTRALSSLFTDRAELFPKLLSHFSDVDDLHIHERLLAAGYGMIVRHPNIRHASDFALCVLSTIFSGRKAPENLLLRDYAAGLVEFAASLGCRTALSKLEFSQPSYGSPRPRLNVTVTEVQLLASRARGRDILVSSTDASSLFYRREIAIPLRCVTGTPLSRPSKPTIRQSARRFESLLRSQRKQGGWEALRGVERLIKRRRTIEEQRSLQPGLRLDKAAVAVEKKLQEAKTRLLQKLNTEETKFFFEHWLPQYIEDEARRSKEKSISPNIAGRWVAREAFRYGWTRKRFGNNGLHDNGRLEGGDIGRKYQRLACSKLFCGLADNYWINDERDDGGPKKYRYATDIPFERDIDPTLYNHVSHFDGENFGNRIGLASGQPVLVSMDGDERLNWPFEGDPGAHALADRVVTDGQGRRWLRLAWHSSISCRGNAQLLHPTGKLQQRRLIHTRSVLCEPTQAACLLASLKSGGRILQAEWDLIPHADGVFVYEGWRGNWPSDKWRMIRRQRSHDEFRVAFPVEGFIEEPRLNLSQTCAGVSFVLAPWLVKSEGLCLSPQTTQITLARPDTPVAWSSNKKDNSGLLVREDWFFEYVTREGLACIWTSVGEREAWRDGEDDGTVSLRRFTAIAHLEGENVSVDHWNQDTFYKPNLAVK